MLENLTPVICLPFSLIDICMLCRQIIQGLKDNYRLLDNDKD